MSATPEPVPPQAITAAADALAYWWGHDGDLKVPSRDLDAEIARVVLEAAAPHLAGQKLPDRPENAPKVQSLATTPVGDWLRRRYPPNPGATHYLGPDGDPGCCAGPHPACTYDAGFREGARAEREACAQLADARAAEINGKGCGSEVEELWRLAALLRETQP